MTGNWLGWLLEGLWHGRSEVDSQGEHWGHFLMGKLITEKLDGIFVLVVWFVLLGFCLVGDFFWLVGFFL